MLLAATCLGAVEAAYRFLHPFSFTGIAAMASLAEKSFRSSWMARLKQ